MPSSTDSPDTYPKHLLSIPYSPLSPLNTLDIHIPAPLSPSDTHKYWIIYLHGGAFRDPTCTSTSILPPSRTSSRPRTSPP
ncbi:MAG: alpha beta-hydrolase [Lasallia pustulata]|uniref:Alpha beta-hydrolase n=1 Tax=Lasallia pustulata TaxID=136370 RepID=A0A5M8PE93_9LECA|nr:MAG: alpha beta-hydrolase [Lasallia pustulata]